MLAKHHIFGKKKQGRNAAHLLLLLHSSLPFLEPVTRVSIFKINYLVGRLLLRVRTFGTSRKGTREDFRKRQFHVSTVFHLPLISTPAILVFPKNKTEVLRKQKGIIFFLFVIVPSHDQFLPIE
jgi:hypothetical protein